jgi:hypothetical protein
MTPRKAAQLWAGCGQPPDSPDASQDHANGSAATPSVLLSLHRHGRRGRAGAEQAGRDPERITPHRGTSHRIHPAARWRASDQGTRHPCPPHSVARASQWSRWRDVSTDQAEARACSKHPHSQPRHARGGLNRARHHAQPLTWSRRVRNEASHAAEGKVGAGVFSR